MVFVATASTGTADKIHAAVTGSNSVVKSFLIEDNFNGTPAAAAADALGVVAGKEDWGLENEGSIPELNIKVDSVSVTAVTKKLKAKWTP